MAEEPKNLRLKILDVSLATILSKGFPATRVDEVCAAAGVTKGSFYHHFDSKDGLAHALIDHYFDRLMAAFEEGSWSVAATPTKRLFAFFDHALKVVKGPFLKPGCLLASFALDLSETHPELRKILEERFDRLVGVVEELFAHAAKESPASVSPKPRALARQFVSVLQGSIVMAKVYGDHARLAEGMRCYVTLVKSQLGV